MYCEKMKIRLSVVLFLFLLGRATCLMAQEPAFPDYTEMADSMTSKMLAFCKANHCAEINAVRKNILNSLNVENKVYGIRPLPQKRKKALPGARLHALCKRSTLVVGTMGYYPQISNYQANVLASAVALSADGICVTNFHVFADVILSGALDYCPANDFMRFVMDCEGNVYAVEAILAVDPVNDFAIFKVNTGGVELVPMPLGDTAREGDDVYCLSHPNGNLYYFTKGIVARNHAVLNKGNGQVALEMQITADYAVGSSGGPIFDERGNLVGIVGSTASIYPVPQSNNNFQMTIKKSIPVKLIKECFEVQ